MERIGEGAVTLDFIGEGESRGFLERLANELGVGHGAGSWASIAAGRPMSFCPRMTCGQPSRYEGFGLTVVEGMAARIPVLVSNIEGPI